MRKKNDQGKIIQALKDKDFLYVWEQIKYVGYADVPDVTERYIIFHKACLDFDPYKNNNFILYYKNYLKFLRFDQNSTFRVTRTRSTIRKLKRQAISPTKQTSEMVDELSKWNN